MTHNPATGYPTPPTSTARNSAAYDMFFPADAARSIGLRRAGDIYRDALPGQRRRKNSAHHALRLEPAVLKWLRLHQLELFTPVADCALASIQDQPGWSEDDGPSSVFAAVHSDQVVPLVRIDTELGQQIRQGLIPLPYDDREVQAVAAVRVPIDRIRAAAGLDARAVMRYLTGQPKAATS